MAKLWLMVNLIAQLRGQSRRPTVVFCLTPETPVSVSRHKCDTCYRRTRPWQLVLWKERPGQKREESLNRGQLTSVSHSVHTFFSSSCSQGASNGWVSTARMDTETRDEEDPNTVPVPGTEHVLSEHRQAMGGDGGPQSPSSREDISKSPLPCLLTLWSASREQRAPGSVQFTQF